MFEEIIDVKPLGKQKAFDITIDSKFNNFYANDILVHNSAHSTTYAYIAYQTLFFKVYHPAYFYAAMINIANNIETIQQIISDAKANGIIILTQSVKESEYMTRATGLKTIRLGFGMVKGMGDSTVADCNSFPSFKSLNDLLGKKFKGINKTQFQNMIDIGAFDDYKIPRETVTLLKDLYQDEKIEEWFTRKRQTLRLETLPKSLEAMFKPELCLKMAMKAKGEVEDDIWSDTPSDNPKKPWELLVEYLLETLKFDEFDAERYSKETTKKQTELMGFTLVESGLDKIERTLRIKGLLPLKEYEDDKTKYFFVVEKVIKALTKTGKTFLQLQLNDGIKAKCWKEIDLEENEIYYGLFKRDSFGYTLNDREVFKAL